MEGQNTIDITKKVHISLKDIDKIIHKATGENTEIIENVQGGIEK
ncbi:MAG TPA: hypothetical protein VN704_06450 [Verrucomicrobiae bacterium]|nr:hypothetical protein [Verrucomicrobiae bacterium]